MGMLAVMILVGASLGYLLAERRKGNFLDKLQYSAVFAIISLIVGIIIQIIIMKFNFF